MVDLGHLCHTGRDRKTVRADVSRRREPGARASSVPDVFDRFEPYVGQRLVDDPHSRATVVFAGVTGLSGFALQLCGAVGRARLRR